MKTIKRLMIILTIILSIYAIAGRLKEMNSISYEQVEYTVQAGDTLYGLAQKYANENQDIREYIYNLKQVNNIGSTLDVGQTIIIFK